MNTCPICNRKLVQPVGREGSPILLMGEFPGQEEIRKGYAFIGQTGLVLESELARVGLPNNRRRLTNLFLHAADSMTKAIKSNCMDFFLEQAQHEFEQAKYILLMGSELCKYYRIGGVMENSGLVVTSTLLPTNNGQVYMVAPNPAIVLKSVVGEFRLALKRFKEKTSGEV